MSNISEEYRARARAAAAKQQATGQDTSRLRKEAERWRDLQEEKASLEERLRDVNLRISDLEFVTLPTIMDEMRIARLDLDPEGNHPGLELVVKPHYYANIAADWDPDRRQAAFQALEKSGNGDLIKTDVQISLSRQERSRLKKLLGGLKKAGFDFAVKEAVHFSTFTAWLKEQTELKHPVPPLEVIGAKIGRICRPRIKK